jgi:hypothetical protein
VNSAHDWHLQVVTPNEKTTAMKMAKAHGQRQATPQ